MSVVVLSYTKKGCFVPVLPGFFFQPPEKVQLQLCSLTLAAIQVVHENTSMKQGKVNPELSASVLWATVPLIRGSQKA